MTLPPHSNTTPPGAPNGSTPNGSVESGRGERAAVRERARIAGLPAAQKRSPKAVAVSIAVHVVLAIVFLRLITFGHGLSGFLDFGKTREQTEERVTYVTTEPPPVEAVTPASPSAPQPVMPPRLQPNISVPVGVPAATPPQAVSPARADTGSGGRSDGTGNGVGEIDPNLKGVKPAYGDPRVWTGARGNGVAPARDGIENLDSIIGFAITSARDSLDSLARAQGKYGRNPGDWTTRDKNGDKWGWDNAGIRLGKVVIPNALLSLLPLNAQANMSGNYTSFERERRLGLARADILRMSERSMGEAEFRKLADELRERRERERRDRLKAPSAPTAPVKVNGPPDKKDR